MEGQAQDLNKETNRTTVPEAVVGTATPQAVPAKA